MLIEQHGAKINQLNDHNENIAHLIFQRINKNLKEKLEYLIAQGVNLLQKNLEEETPVHYFALYYQGNMPEEII